MTLRRRTAALALLAAPFLASAPARAAEESVDVALVLLSDVSRSIDDIEFKMQKEGYAAALTDRRVIEAIKGGATGGIAIAYVEFAGPREVTTVVDWHTIRDAASAQSFATKVQTASRTSWGRTAISSGIDHSVTLIAASGLEATRRVIDVAGDGTNNAGRDIMEARDAAIAAGITINALAIINERPVNWNMAHVQPPGGLTKWFEDNVIGGPGAFALEVRDFRSFGEAMTRKLINEIAALPVSPRG